jgi:hypothetical protein
MPAGRPLSGCVESSNKAAWERLLTTKEGIDRLRSRRDRLYRQFDMTTDDDSCLLETQLMYTTLAKRKCCDACVQPHDLTGNLAKIHTAIRLYDEGIYAREILREQAPGKAVDNDHRCGVWNCFREGHSGLSSKDLNMSRTACHSGKKVCTHIPRCLNPPGARFRERCLEATERKRETYRCTPTSMGKSFVIAEELLYFATSIAILLS